jgi:hypothetical protein
MKLDTKQLSPRQSIYLDKMSSDIKSTERADDVQSYNQSVMSDKQASFAKSWENRNNMDDIQSHKSSISSDRQTHFDQSGKTERIWTISKATSHQYCLLGKQVLIKVAKTEII